LELRGDAQGLVARGPLRRSSFLPPGHRIRPLGLVVFSASSQEDADADFHVVFPFFGLVRRVQTSSSSSVRYSSSFVCVSSGSRPASIHRSNVARLARQSRINWRREYTSPRLSTGPVSGLTGRAASVQSSSVIENDLSSVAGWGGFSPEDEPVGGY